MSHRTGQFGAVEGAAGFAGAGFAGAGFADEIISAIEARAMWGRYGL